MRVRPAVLLGAGCAATWAYLMLGHGRFWQGGPVLAPDRPLRPPPVTVVVPARDEAEGVERALRSLLAQEYAGELRVILVDDGSTDGTGAIARALADPRLTVIDGAPRPRGWSGKLWALSQGVAAAGDASLLLLTDADIEHDPRHLATLVAKLERDGLDMASEMVALNCESTAERLLVPAFVFFFQMLYPFARTADPGSRSAAAAGGTVLLRAEALRAAGGLEAMRGALIDDVTLAGRLKRLRGAGGADLARALAAGALGAAVSARGGRVAHGGAHRLRAASLLAGAARGDGGGHGAGLGGAAAAGAARAGARAVARARELGGGRPVLPSDAAALPAVAAVGAAAAGGGRVLHRRHGGLGRGPPSRARRALEAARVHGGEGVREARKSLLFLRKKKQKDLAPFGPNLGARPVSPREAPNPHRDSREQEFFASFFQKRSACLLAFLPCLGMPA